MTSAIENPRVSSIADLSSAYTPATTGTDNRFLDFCASYLSVASGAAGPSSECDTNSCSQTSGSTDFAAKPLIKTGLKADSQKRESVIPTSSVISGLTSFVLPLVSMPATESHMQVAQSGDRSEPDSSLSEPTNASGTPESGSEQQNGRAAVAPCINDSQALQAQYEFPTIIAQSVPDTTPARAQALEPTAALSAAVEPRSGNPPTENSPGSPSETIAPASKSAAIPIPAQVQPGPLPCEASINDMADDLRRNSTPTLVETHPQSPASEPAEGFEDGRGVRQSPRDNDESDTNGVSGKPLVHAGSPPKPSLRPGENDPSATEDTEQAESRFSIENRPFGVNLGKSCPASTPVVDGILQFAIRPADPPPCQTGLRPDPFQPNSVPDRTLASPACPDRTRGAIIHEALPVAPGSSGSPFSMATADAAVASGNKALEQTDDSPAGSVLSQSVPYSLPVAAIKQDSNEDTSSTQKLRSGSCETPAISAISAVTGPAVSAMNATSSAPNQPTTGNSQLDNNPGTTLRRPIEFAPLPTSGAVQLARAVNRIAQAEMRIGMNTSAFGNVEVRTTVHANDVGLVIGSEKGDLRSLLANELPAIASTLREQDLRLHQVNFHQGLALSNQMSSGGDSQRRYLASGPRRSWNPEPAEVHHETIEIPEPRPGTVQRGLSILA